MHVFFDSNHFKEEAEHRQSDLVHSRDRYCYGKIDIFGCFALVHSIAHSTVPVRQIETPDTLLKWEYGWREFHTSLQ